ncbi:MerR family transcriptional regulator [Cryptosporangium arvum]|uniref:MerR family transcriptional regulator n=1 Tax=Cryptosporangium arvum TaxID=80871 RepID=UPI0004B18391|nr:MerR family transcriptional regulator [Cryptosporangium arvum]
MRMKIRWSTRELAEVAGTTVKTVRHYHRTGLLPEPHRADNGYRQYETTHLIRLLRIRRLVELGVSLPEITVIEGSGEGAEQTFRALDAELAASIEHQQRVRAELALIMGDVSLAGLPSGFDGHVGSRSRATHAFVLVAVRLLDPSVVETLRELMSTPRSDTATEFDTLPGDANEQTRQSLAERYAPEVIRTVHSHPRLKDVAERAATGLDMGPWSVVIEGILELHNTAQIDVIKRMYAALHPPGTGTAPDATRDGAPRGRDRPTRTRRGWSTRELAEIAGLTVKTVRHYHAIGLLAEPERLANGYKQYRLPHLVRLLEIRRLTDLGMRLSDIAATQHRVEDAEQLFSALDSATAADIERKERTRAELAEIRKQQHLTELPPGFGGVADDLTGSDRTIAMLGSRVFEPWVMQELKALMSHPRTACAREFDSLPADADEKTRQLLAERYAPEVHQHQQRHPDLMAVAEDGKAGRGPRHWAIIGQAITELYNPAQLDVLHRMKVIIAGQVESRS